MSQSKSSNIDTLEGAFKRLNEEPIAKDFFKDYYVKRAQSPIGSLKNDISNAGDVFQKHLFSGHRGSGKTTELYFLKTLLEQDDRFYVTFVAAIKDIKLSDIVYTDLLFILIVKALNLLEERNVKIKKNKRKQMEEDLMQLKGDLDKEEIREKKMGISLTAAAEWFQAFFTWDRTIRQRIRLTAEGLVDKVINNFNVIISSIEEASGKKLVIIVDDLEKVTDLDRMVDILIRHAYVIGRLNCHIVLTIPPSVRYSPELAQVQQTYGVAHFLPPFYVLDKKGRTQKDQVDLMVEIVRRRLSEKMISSDLLRNLAERSGGLVTDYTRMIKVSLNNMIQFQEECISDKSADVAFGDLVNDYSRITSPQYFPLLIEIYNKKDTTDHQNIQFRELLYNLMVLAYYTGGDEWYDLHPAVKEVLRRNKTINP